jgi:outer membrane protein OmpA-like peptidoglycan-associated protein
VKGSNSADFGQVVAMLRDYPNALLIIEGYTTDNRDGEQLNDRLSLQLRFSGRSIYSRVTDQA